MKRLTTTVLILFLAILASRISTFGQAAPPAITIEAPAEGETVPLGFLTVAGLAGGLPNNQLIVQALDSNGVVVGSQPTTVAADAPGGAGPWTVQIELRVGPGTPGRIRAFAEAPGGGGILAETSIAVTFGEAAEPTPEPTLEPTPGPTLEPTPEQPPAQPAVVINSPANGEQVSADQVLVVGVGSAIPGNNVIVQARDASGAVLDQQTAVVNAPPGESGEWSATLSPSVAPGTVGTIYAYAYPPADSPVMAEAVVNVIFGAAPPPESTPSPTPISPSQPVLNIDAPRDGDEVSRTEIVVMGNGAAWPQNLVVVQARLTDGTILAEATASLDAPPGGSGVWRVTLQLNADPGATGSIYAYVPSAANDAILVEDAVSVRYGTPEPTPVPTSVPTADLWITAPHNGAVVPPTQFDVYGIGTALPDNFVIVRALNSNNVVIAESSTTVNAPMGGTGPWQLSIQPNAAPGSVGSLVAFSIDRSSGRVVADDRIQITYGVAPAPIVPELEITQPPSGAVVDTAGGFEVAGVAQGLFEGNVIVQLQDLNSNVLYQTVTTARPDGAWSVPINIRIADGTQSRIYAYSTSPADGSVVADDLVYVTFSSPCTPRSDWPIYVVQPGDTLFGIAQQTGTTVGELTIANCLTNPNVIVVGQELRVPNPPAPGIEVGPPVVTIAHPASGAGLSLTETIRVTGTTEWTVAGGLFVRALDNNGRVLDENRVQPTSLVSNGEWQWEVELDLADAIPGSRGTLFAYALSITDGSIIASDTIDVRYGDDSGESYVTILSPEPYAFLPLENGVTVTGTGRSLAGGNVIVRAEDMFGRDLISLPAVLDPQAIAAEGAWTLTFPLSYVGRGRIIAYSVNTSTGSVIAEAERDVYFGDPDSQPTYTLITYPLPATVIRADDLRPIAGYPRGTFDDSVYLSVLDSDNRVRFVLPVPVNPQTGFWSITPAIDLSLSSDGEISLFATATAPNMGQVIANDTIRLRLERPTVAGTVTYSESVVLPSDAVVTVQIVNLSLADAPPEIRVLGEQVIYAPGQVPIDFAVPYNPAQVDEQVLYGIVATIRDGADNLLFLNTEPVMVLTQGNPTEGVEVVVQTP